MDKRLTIRLTVSYFNFHDETDFSLSFFSLETDFTWGIAMAEGGYEEMEK